MTLTPGTRLGVYDIRAQIGAGGMGEVYRARDTKLDRDVALKILPEVFATDPERLARFAREAKMLAAHNHPHIAQIYGIEESGHLRALVLELVDGPTLADRIAHGPIPIDEALTLARQIAGALEAGQRDHRAPFILPDGRHFVYYARGTPEVRGVHVARLDGTETKRLLAADGAAVYASSGHLLFPRQGELMAQPFDASTLTLDGEVFRVAESVSVNPGPACPRSPRQHPDRLRTASTASVARSSPGSIGPAGGSRRLPRRTKEAWPIPPCRPMAAGSLSVASSAGIGTCG